MKKNKIAAAYKNNINYRNVSVETIEALKAVQRIEHEKNLNLLPITDVNKLAVLYYCEDENGEIQITFFDRTKTSSSFDVLKKAAERKFNIVGEDCTFYPAKIVGPAIVPNWELVTKTSKYILGCMHFDVFVKRMKKLTNKQFCNQTFTTLSSSVNEVLQN